jgi:hypothetical protein
MRWPERSEPQRSEDAPHRTSAPLQRGRSVVRCTTWCTRGVDVHMATITPRIQVTLSEEAYRIITRLAELQRSPRSRIIAEVINDLAPVLDDLLNTLEAAARIRQDNIEEVKQVSLEAVERMNRIVDEATEQFDWVDQSVRRGGWREPMPARPRACNTGATDAPKSLKSHKPTPSKKRAGK